MTRETTTMGETTAVPKEGAITDEVMDTLRAGLRWLYETEQPAGALLQHHGEGLPKIVATNRSYTFVPRGWDGHVVIVVDVVDVRYAGDGPPSNPIRRAELHDLTRALARLGHRVVHTWNGHPAATGSLALDARAHPTLLAAVDRYRRGCQEHPARTVFCPCGWFERGYSQIIRPAVSVTSEDWS